MQPTRNSLSENIRAQSVELLNKHLAAAIDLHAQVKQAHWNVRGPGFIAIHELFDKVSVEVENLPKSRAALISSSGSSNLTLLPNEQRAPLSGSASRPG